MQKKSVLFFSFPSDSTFGEAKGRKKIERRTKRIYSFFMPRCRTFGEAKGRKKNRAQTKSEGPFSGSLLVAEEVTDPTPLPLPLKGGESVRSSFVRETQQLRTIARLVLSLRNTFTRNAQLSPPFKGRGKGVGSVTFSSSRNAHHPSPLSSPTTPHKKILREKIFCGGFP